MKRLLLLLGFVVLAVAGCGPCYHGCGRSVDVQVSDVACSPCRGGCSCGQAVSVQVSGAACSACSCDCPCGTVLHVYEPLPFRAR